jgi:gamma-glutamylcyclotransferase (GGCT)/AIG2-like uncharacterized protein YtfP
MRYGLRIAHITDPTPVFIYGTLRRDERNHAQLDGARFVGHAYTAPRYALVDLGEYPALLEGGTDAVHGEVYEVEPSHLERLDAFEEHPTVYVRRSIELEGGRRVFAYVLPRERAGDAPRIPGGDWKRR